MASGEMVAWQRERVRWLRSKGEGERSWCGKWKERWWRGKEMVAWQWQGERWLGKGRDGGLGGERGCVASGRRDDGVARGRGDVVWQGERWWRGKWKWRGKGRIGGAARVEMVGETVTCKGRDSGEARGEMVAWQRERWWLQYLPIHYC